VRSMAILTGFPPEIVRAELNRSGRRFTDMTTSQTGMGNRPTPTGASDAPLAAELAIKCIISSPGTYVFSA
jgi:hypothetical protein